MDGHIYELDGLREAPLDLGAIREGEDWVDAVRPIINARIRKLVYLYQPVVECL